MKAPLPLAAVAPLPASGSGPLYRQVKRELQRQIEAGRYAPGDTLPREADMAVGLGVSIGTLRRAVDELVQENLLVRRQGRGTFVALHGADRFLFQFFHIEARPPDGEAVAAGPRALPRVECLAFDAGTAQPGEAGLLGLGIGEPVLRMVNRLSLEGRPVVHDRICVAAALFKGLDERRFVERPGTIYRLYQSDFGISVLRTRERLRAVVADEEVARLLGARPGTPMLQVQRQALGFGDRPVELRISTVDTARHDYVTALSRSD